MPEKSEPSELERMAGEMFELMKIASTVRARARSGNPEELTEAEFLTLDVLNQDGPMSVGEIQKRIGVVPAQMSRIIRSLESKGGESFVTCSINPDDRRKIDVRIAAKGRVAHRAYGAARLGFATQLLRDLSPDERQQFMHILERIRAAISKSLAPS